MDKIKKYCLKEISKQHFDSLAICTINFSNGNIEGFLLGREKELFFDLASISKPLNLSAAFFLLKGKFTLTENLLLNHHGGLPSWGRLDKSSWKEQILNYEISSSDILYSDFSALRLMLELEKKYDVPFVELVKKIRNDELFFWKDIQKNKYKKEQCVPTGFRNNKIIQGVVHDDNAFMLNTYTSHAGMFGSIDGLSKSLLKLNELTDFISIMKNDIAINNDRFINGWDTCRNKKSLAGKGAGKFTFGHLGFTGTSLWIDAEKKIGQIILTNETIKYWYDREKLNQFRKEIGTMIWSKY